MQLLLSWCFLLMEKYHLSHVCIQDKSGVQILFTMPFFEDIFFSSYQKNRETSGPEIWLWTPWQYIGKIILLPDVLVTKSQSFKYLMNVKFLRLVIFIATSQQSTSVFARVFIVLYCALAILTVDGIVLLKAL